MHKAIAPRDMRRIESSAIARGVPGLLLMEQAAQAVVEALFALLGGASGRRALFVCGPGNNGGDGLAAARRFCQLGGKAVVWLLPGKLSELTKLNLDYARHYTDIIEIQDALPEFPPVDCVVDALLGTGLAGAPIGIAALAIRAVNQAGVTTIAVDVPSGMNADSGNVPGNCVRAAQTVTFHRVKQGLYLTRHKDLVGNIICSPIGLPAYFDDADGPDVADESDLPAMLGSRSRDAHKGDCGRVLLYAGSHGMAGAAAMAAKACLRAGAGLVTVACPDEIMPIVQTLVPNATCVSAQTLPAILPRHDVAAAGCGLGQSPDVWERLVLLSSGRCVVWDADALNLLSLHPGFTFRVPAVITPHPGEAARLLGTEVGYILDAPLDAARRLALKYRCTAVLKGATTVITDGTRVALNVCGTPGMAKGGSGDALTGIIAALACRLDPVSAAQAACLWHGMAGIRAAARHGVTGMLTGELIDELIY
jgi:ADP-dependent NAD(P)H-hydrate dehydratase / NAD(P)H-hydrate epimerase